MNPIGFFRRQNRGHRRMTAAGSGVVFLLLTLTIAGCGETTTSTGAPPAGLLSRPAPGTVEMIDGRGDISGSQDLAKAPTWLELNWSSVSQNAGSLKFTMDTAGTIPEQMAPGVAGEWGFMIDTDQDGTPDWVIYTSNTVKDGWTAGLFNPKTKERLAGSQFSGTATHADTKIELTIAASAIGAGQEFKWFAFANEYTKSADNQNVQAGDHIPDLGTPTSSADWLPYP